MKFKKRIWLLFSVIILVCVTIMYFQKVKTEDGIKETFSHINTVMATITEGKYKEKIYTDIHLRYAFLSENDKKEIIAATKSLVEHKYYELGSTLYHFQITFNTFSLQIKATPLYDKNVLESIPIKETKQLSDREFVEHVKEYVESHFKYLILDETYKPLDVFLEEKEGQCYNFVELFYILANERGLPVRVEVNDYHAWNLVQIDGEWVKVDLTLNLENGGASSESR